MSIRRFSPPALRAASLFVSLFGLIAPPLAGAGPAKTEVLPADGGDLGKAWTELAVAMKAGDAARAGKLLDPKAWHLADKQKSWYTMFDDLVKSKPAGGRRQGDRATLFLTSSVGNPHEYRYVSATRTSGGWQFDTPTTLGSSFGTSEMRDCTASKLFPCGVKTAPDSVVSGTITPPAPMPDGKTKYWPIDGIAVPMVAKAGGASTGTRVLLSIHGINPEALPFNGDPDEVKGWLGWPVISLEIAKGGKTAKMEYYDGLSRKTVDVAKGLTVDTSSPGRIRGTLKTVIEKVAFDVSFDLASTAACVTDAYRCGADAAP